MKHPNWIHVVPCLLGLLMLSFPSNNTANEIGFLEEFALADDRNEALSQLVPGTPEFYFYSALVAQQEGRFNDVNGILEEWEKRHGRTSQLQQIRHRQVLLTYRESPEATVNYLKRELGLRFDHQKEQLRKAPNFPTKLDANSITWDSFYKRNGNDQNLSRVTDGGLDHILRNEVVLTPAQRRDLLRRIKYPDYDRLVGIIAADLRTKESKGFGEFPIHQRLTEDQLVELLGLRPELIHDQKYVSARLVRMRPATGSLGNLSLEESEAYLASLWEFVKDLAPSFNSQKASILFRRLDVARRTGEYPDELFLEYLKLPRHGHYIEPKYLQQKMRGTPLADLSADYSKQLGFGPIRTDDELVRSYLEKYFQADESYQRFQPYIRESYLKEVFATTKLLYGIGDAERWYAMLDPARVEELRKRVEISLLLTNESRLSPEDEVSLQVELKNVSDLLVKLYHINEFNFYRDENREINTDLKLDGLIANKEFSLRYDDTAMLRHAEVISLEGLENQRGVWVVELIGNGISSRALIRKGGLHYVSQPTAGGEIVRVLTEDNEPATDPMVLLAGKSYQPDENGLILLPFSKQGGAKLILSGSGMSSLAEIDLPRESYAFDTGILLSQESLIPGQRAALAIRPQLTLGGEKVDLSVIEEPKLLVRLVDQDGIESVSERRNFPLLNDEESIHEFLVPDRLREIKVEVTGKIPLISETSGEQNLQSTHQFDVNGIDTQPATRDLYFSRNSGGYQLEVLGRSGEKLADRSVRVFLHHKDFSNAHSVNLKSDPSGTISLGKLEGISRVDASLEGASHRSWPLDLPAAQVPSVIQVSSRDSVDLPIGGLDREVNRSDIAVFELRGNALKKDWYSEAKKASGVLTLENLDPGDYLVYLRDSNRSISLRVVDANSRSLGYALGKDRLLETGYRDMPVFRTIEVKDDSIGVEIGNLSKQGRLHLLATRFLPEFPPFEWLATPMRDNLYLWNRGGLNSLYVSGRDIGDEYRYILERRTTKVFPGNMLPRPGLILNPWALQETQTDIEIAEEGEQFKKSAQAKAGRRAGDPGAPPEAKRKAMGESNVSPSFTFLGSQPVLLANLKVDENGRASIDREILQDRQHLHLLAVDGDHVSYRSLAIDPVVENVPTRDLTLSEGLDSEKPYTQQRNVTLLLPDEKLEIDDFRSARLESYSTIGELFGTLQSIQPNETLAEFQFIRNWPELEIAEKQSLYSKHACHELSFFLSRKDPEFFKEVITPYLRNKKNKTFLDHYLLESDLTGYLRPWEHGRLNIVEKILLSQRLGGDERGRTGRYLEDLMTLLPPDPMQESVYFQQALLGRRSDGEGGGGKFMFSNGVFEEERGMAFGGGGGGAKENESKDRANYAARKELKMAMEAQVEKAEAAAPADFFAEMEMDDADGIEMLRATVSDLRNKGKQLALFEALEATREWAENNYYKLPIESQLSNLITANAFWADFAAWDGEGGFYSREFPVATRNFSEMMFVLSLLDLPFSSEDPEITVEDNLLTFVAGSPSVLFHEEIRESVRDDDSSPILVSQNYYRLDDRYIQEQGQTRDKFVTEEFLTGVVYGSQVVVTNPSSSPHLLELLIQVPKGAIPVSASHYTKSYPVLLEPFSTSQQEIAFYFPETSGDEAFPIYPVQVAKDEKVIASGESFSFRVVDTLSNVDEASWEYLSQEGSEKEVLDFLAERNLQMIDLSRIAWRVRESKEFFERVTRILGHRRSYDPTLWSYGLVHGGLDEARQFLKHQEGFLRQCGNLLECDLVSIEPVERHWHQHLEYSPLVNARAHSLGRNRNILNDQFYRQYNSLLSVLQYRTKLQPEDRLAVTAYLLLQDRIEEALEWHESVSRDELDEKLQYDYLSAYVSLYREEVEKAQNIAVAYEEFPVDRWREKFGKVLSQIEEIDGKAVEKNEENREDRLDDLSSREAGIDLLVEGRKVTLNYDGVAEAKIHYYEMDLEFLFSSEPFVSGGSRQFSYIEPNQTQVIPLPEEANSIDIALPEKYSSRNILLEVVAEGQRKTVPIYSNQLRVNVVDRYGRLEVRDQEEGDPLSKTYVKVYSRMRDGSVRFYKDGYTDLRGKFDYVGLSTNDLDNVEKFSLLVMSREHGALVREVDPPRQ